MNSSAAGSLYQARMRPNSNTKTPETHNLDALNDESLKPTPYLNLTTLLTINNQQIYSY